MFLDIPLVHQFSISSWFCKQYMGFLLSSDSEKVVFEPFTHHFGGVIRLKKIDWRPRNRVSILPWSFLNPSPPGHGKRTFWTWVQNDPWVMRFSKMGQKLTSNPAPGSILPLMSKSKNPNLQKMCPKIVALFSHIWVVHLKGFQAYSQTFPLSCLLADLQHLQKS